MFDIEGGQIKLSADSLAIPPFKHHYEASRDKVTAIKEIEYVVWLYKWKTPYKAYAPEDRPSKVGQDVFGDPDYTPTEEVKTLISRFQEFLSTPLIRLYESAEEGVEYLISLLNGLKLLVMASKDLTLEEQLKVGAGVAKIVKEVEPMGKSIISAKKRAMADETESGKVKGGGTLGLYEIPRK